MTETLARGTKFVGHAKMVLKRVFKDFSWGRDLTISTTIALSSLAIQFYFGSIIPSHEKKILILSIVGPYILVIGVHLLWRLVTAPHKVYSDLEAKAIRLNGELENKKRETDELKKQFSAIGGPELLVGFAHSNWGDGPLIVVNCRGGLAHNVTLRIPEDGSLITSKTITTLRDDDSEVAWQAGEQNRIIANDIINRDAYEHSLFVTLMDADFRWLVYRFEPLEKLSGYRPSGKTCLGRKPSA